MGQFDGVSPETLKDVLLKKIAVETTLSEDIVEKVISFEFKQAKEKTYTCNEIEISGFGKFVVSKYKAGKKARRVQTIITNMEKILILRKLTTERALSVKKRIEVSIESLNDLISRIKS